MVFPFGFIQIVFSETKVLVKQEANAIFNGLKVTEENKNKKLRTNKQRMQ